MKTLFYYFILFSPVVMLVGAAIASYRQHPNYTWRPISGSIFIFLILFVLPYLGIYFLVKWIFY